MNLEVGYDLDTLLGSVALNYKLTLGDDATGDMPMYWGNIVSGTAYLTYRDKNGRDNLVSGQYYFNSGVDQNIPVFTTSYFNVYGSKKTTSSGAPFVSVSSTGISLAGGGGWRYYCSLPFYDANPRESLSVSFTSSNYPTFYGNLSSSYYGNWSYLGKSELNAVNYTNIPAVHDANSDIPYIPVSGEMTYDDLRRYIVSEYNEQNPEETISIDDLPDIDGNLPTEETTEAAEPSYDVQPFSLDYGEILGEKEMESIIAETRYVLDTTPYEIESVDYGQAVSEPYAELKKNAVLDADTKTAISKIYDVAVAMAKNDFLPLYAFGAILSIVMWFVFRR